MPALAVLPPLATGCVVQRDQPIPVRGLAERGAAVRVLLAGWQIDTQADGDGRWQVVFQPLLAGGPHQLAVESGGQRLALEDILVGDVWLASGQSNMQWTLGGCGALYADDVAAADDPRLRFATVPCRRATGPVPPEAMAWHRSTPATAPGCSAVAWFFARERRRRHPDVPVGLICCAWGGTCASAWMDPETVAATPELRGPEHRLDLAAERLAPYRDALARWRSRVDERDPGIVNWWADLSTDDHRWTTGRLPFEHAGSPLAKVVGSVWYRRRVRLPEGWRNRNLTLHLGSLAHFGEVYVNGVKVAETDPLEWNTQWADRIVTGISATRFRPGEDNLIAVRVFATGQGRAGLWRAGPGGLRLRPDDTPSGEAIALADGWRWRVGWDGARDPALPAIGLHPGDPASPNWPSLLWHGMVAPLLPLPVQGVLWYQGESDAGRADAYRGIFRQLIAGWRRRLEQPELPFLFVQLASYGAGLPPPRQPAASPWAELRQAQAAALELPRTGMACIIDVGDNADIHPLRKRPVGVRLARAAAAILDGDGDRGGPRCAGLTVQPDGSARVAFLGLRGLATSDGKSPAHVAAAGADGRFAWAEAAIDGETLIVRLPGQAVQTVRYAWADDPAAANLCDAAGEPVAPFNATR